MGSANLQIATFGGGCFWCTEAVFQQIRGVTLLESGYSGGQVHQPSYEQICTGRTGHAEVIRITFDAELITYSELLDIFFVTHDPTTLNRQGADTGTQYRSVIFFHDAHQEQEARAAMQRAAGHWPDPIVTELSPAPQFYIAEDYHQNYFRRNPQQGYCAFVVAPKVAKARKAFADKLVS
ncbi:peptide-methionine (S)-S-oxide reductase MsrA [Undibacterium cyanobacteriorum]|uniref:Peptide methionine sulfoxide reductase MsrA n=1 Tax=Undibacterium cyanobacteriorum TaxID=3073561 RepID=A0ABY9RJL3_9BURK|nr:peptide-methionine (S)-S-oxide reductase MsrA [Undibacterium sp. 20NA77.5]WMW81427.1 peptide-methionine (S)-S-oxide reductase MsrA [Undibacterium sp. 20NA77.5]